MPTPKDRLYINVLIAICALSIILNDPVSFVHFFTNEDFINDLNPHPASSRPLSPILLSDGTPHTPPSTKLCATHPFQAGRSPPPKFPLDSSPGCAVPLGAARISAHNP